MKRTLLVALLGLFSLSSASAGLTAFLKIPDIPGESQAVEHEDEIDIHDMSWSVSHPVVEGRSTEVDLSDLKVVKELDKSSPKLMEACATGKAIDEIVLYARKDSGDAHLDYLKITLTNVYVTSYEMLSTSGDADDRPTEEVAFYYNKISFEYVRGDETGGAGEMVEGIYDRKTGTTQ